MNLTNASALPVDAGRARQSGRRRRRWPPGTFAFFLLGVAGGLLHARLLGLF